MARNTIEILVEIPNDLYELLLKETKKMVAVYQPW